ncbi:MAG: hypothetical protein PHY23_00345 [Oscillospiraceae bacterium]|nr:hypothetical protein [Oscillospiraceae bacterium]
MSYNTWHEYGFGICTDEIAVDSVERLQALIHMAPEFEKEITEWLNECEITSPTIEDYFEFDDDYHGELATILQAVIKEAEGLKLCYCDDFDGRDYLIFLPQYPWSANEGTKDMTEERLTEIFTKYVAVLTDSPIKVDYQSVENGG